MPERPAGSERHTGSAPGWDRRGTVGKGVGWLSTRPTKREWTRVHAGRRLHRNSRPSVGRGGLRLAKALGAGRHVHRPAPARGLCTTGVGDVPLVEAVVSALAADGVLGALWRSHAGLTSLPVQPSSLTRRSAFIVRGEALQRLGPPADEPLVERPGAPGRRRAAAGRVSGSSWPPRRRPGRSSGALEAWPPSNGTSVSAAAAVDLAILLDYEQLGPSRPLARGIHRLVPGGPSGQVRTAAEQLLRASPHAPATQACSPTSLPPCGPTRDLDIFAGADARAEGPPDDRNGRLSRRVVGRTGPPDPRAVPTHARRAAAAAGSGAVSSPRRGPAQLAGGARPCGRR